MSHHKQLKELWSCKFTLQILPRSCPETLDDENPSTSRIILVHIEDVWKLFEAKLGGPIMSVRCIPGRQIIQMNRHVFHPICKIHRRLCHRDLQNLNLKPLTTPQVHPLQAQNTIHGNLELITHFSVVYLYLSSQLTHALYLHCIGKPCDENGHYLPKGSPPPPRPAQAADGWTPFADRIQFKLADFLYRQEEMSQGNINHLLKLWALSLMQRGSLGPFDSYKHIYNTIDAIEEGSYFILSRSGSHSCATKPR